MREPDSALSIMYATVLYAALGLHAAQPALALYQKPAMHMRALTKVDRDGLLEGLVLQLAMARRPVHANQVICARAKSEQ